MDVPALGGDDRPLQGKHAAQRAIGAAIAGLVILPAPPAVDFLRF